MRQFWVLLVWMLAHPAAAQDVLTTAGNAQFEIATTSTGGVTSPAYFRGWPQLCVRVCADAVCNEPCDMGSTYDAGGAESTSVFAGQGVVTAARAMAGLSVRRHIFAPQAGQEDSDRFIRYVDEFANGGNAPVTIMVRIGSVDGATRLSDGTERIWKTSSDDSTFESTDRWIALDDDGADTGLPTTGVLFQGSGSRSPVSAQRSDINEFGDAVAVSWDFRNLTIEPGQTIRLMTVIVTEAVRQDAYKELENLMRAKPIDLLVELSEGERSEILNFDVNAINSAPVADAGGPYSIEEGETLQLTGVSSYDAQGELNADQGIVAYAWDLKQDGELRFDDSDQSSLVLAPDANDPIRSQLLQAGQHLFYLRVTDAEGKTDVDTARIVVRDVPPSILDVTAVGEVGDTTAANAVDEGSELTLNIQMNERNFPDPYTFSYDWDTSDGDRFDILASPNARQVYRYTKDGVYTGRVVVRDDDGVTPVERLFTVTVNNVAPVINQVEPLEIILLTEGVPFDVSVIAEDVGDDPLTYSYTIEGCEFVGGIDQGLELTRTQAVCPDDRQYLLVVEVCDDGGACVVRESPINVDNFVPEILGLSTDPVGQVNEGQPVQVTVTANDLGADTLIYSFDFDGDGEFSDDVKGSLQPTAQHVYDRPGRYTVAVLVSDQDAGGIAIQRQEIVVANVKPTVEVNGANRTRLGVEETYNCVATDPGTVRFIYNWDLDGDGQYEKQNSGSQVTHIFPARGNYTIGCQVDDGEGELVETTYRIDVANQRPDVSVAVISDPAGWTEGAQVTIRVTATGQNIQGLVYSYDFDDDGTVDLETEDATVRHTFPDQGNYVIRVFVDDGIDQIDASTTVRIANVVPRIRILPLINVVNEGDEVEVIATIDEPGDDEVTVYWDLDGDGERDCNDAQSPACLQDIAVDGRVTRRFVIQDNDVETLMAWAEDNDDPQGRSSEARLAIRVNNLPPYIPEGWMPKEAYEGEPYRRSIPVQDPAGVFDPVTFSLSGNPPEGIVIDEYSGLLLSAGEARELWTPTYEQYRDNSPVNLQVRMTDDDGGSTIQLIEIPIIPIDDDEDGLPDTYERQTFGREPAMVDPAGDEDEDGRTNETEWRERTDPTVYNGPGQTRLIAPDNESRLLTPAPVLEAARVESVSGELVRIEFEVFGDADGMDMVISSGPVEQPADGNTTWQVPPGTLEEDQWYGWRARSIGERLQTQWSDLWTFQVNAVNSQPSAPELISPPDGARIDDEDADINFVAKASSDQDGDEITYTIRWFKKDPQTGQITTTSARGELYEDDGVQKVKFVAPPLSEDTTYTWDVISQDTRSGLSQSVEQWSFHVDQENSVPTAPELHLVRGESLIALKAENAPTDEQAPIAPTKPTFRAGRSTDLEMDQISYVFSITDLDGMVIVADESIAAMGDNSAEWTSSTDLEEDAFFKVAVHAEDDRGGQSSSVVGILQVSGKNEAPPTPTHLTPADGSQIVGERAIVFWSRVDDPEGSPVTYVIEYCFDGTCQKGEPQDQTSYNFGPMAKDGRTIKWRVEAFDADGLGSGQTQPWSFSFVTGAQTQAEESGCDCQVSSTSSSSPWVFVGFLLALGLIRPRRESSH